MLADGLPPCSDIERVRAVIADIPAQDREDAAQEAWVAYLSGEPVAAAVRRYYERWLRERQLRRQYALNVTGQPGRSRKVIADE